jgi:hypothetical protein
VQLVSLRIRPEEVQLAAPSIVEPHEFVDEAETSTYQVRGGRLLVTTWNDQVHSVTYQTPKKLFFLRFLRNRAMLIFYGAGQPWTEDWPVDFGKSQRSGDGQVRSLYASLCDYMTFSTAEFDIKCRESALSQNAA